jgi:hypothetical protein
MELITGRNLLWFAYRRRERKKTLAFTKTLREWLNPHER